MAEIIILGFMLLLALLTLLGLGADSRDPEWSVGRLLAPRRDAGRKGR